MRLLCLLGIFLLAIEGPGASKADHAIGDNLGAVEGIDGVEDETVVDVAEEEEEEEEGGTEGKVSQDITNTTVENITGSNILKNATNLSEKSLTEEAVESDQDNGEKEVNYSAESPIDAEEGSGLDGSDEEVLDEDVNNDQNDEDTTNKEVDSPCSVCYCYTLSEAGDSVRMDDEMFFKLANTSDKIIKVDCSNRNISTWTSMKGSNLAVDLSNNLLEELPDFLEKGMVSLDLSNNQVTSLPPFHFVNLAQSLVLLNLAGNMLSITGLSDTSLQMNPEQHLSQAWLLETLSLADNRLHSLPADLFGQLSRLQSLDLSSNPLSEMDAATVQAIGGIVTLNSLSLADCGLTSLSHGLVDGLTQLESLDLSGNPFTTVDPRLRSAPSLTSLVLDRTHIQHLDHNSFVGLEDLRNLSISSSPFLKTVESGTFDPLNQLEELILAENPHLSYIHPEAWRPSPQGLLVLQISGNNLRYIPSMLLNFSAWQSIEDLDLRGNNWQCDCHNLWMLRTLVPVVEERNPDSAAETLCGGPIRSEFIKMSLAEVRRTIENNTSRLPCDGSKFDPYKRDFNLRSGRGWEKQPSNPHGLAAGVAVLCLLAILSSAMLVLFLQRQRKARGGKKLLRFPRVGRAPHVAYQPTQGVPGVKCAAGTGMVNPEYRDTEQEMADMAMSGNPFARPSVQVTDWPSGPDN